LELFLISQHAILFIISSLVLPKLYIFYIYIHLNQKGGAISAKLDLSWLFLDYDYDYYGYGDYRGGYSDPYFDDYYRYDDYYYDYALHPSAAPRGRGRQPQPVGFKIFKIC
jgi:hypothetical protein